MQSLKLQLLFSHLVLIALLMVAMAGAIVDFIHLGGSIDRIVHNNLRSVIAAQNMKETLERQDSAATFYLDGETQLARTQYQQNWPLFEDAYQIEAHNITEPGEQKMADDIGHWFFSYRIAIQKLLYAPVPMTRKQAHDYYFGTLKPAFLRLKARAEDVLNLNQNAIYHADVEARVEARRSALIGACVMIGSALLALMLALRSIQAALSPLRSLARQAEEIGAGHWNQRIEVRRSDEIGVLATAFNDMASKLRETWETEEARLHRAERMSDAALANLYDPVIVTDARGCVVHLNHAAEGLFGRAQDLAGVRAAQVVKDSRIVEAIQRAIHHESVSAEEDEGGFVSLESDEARHTYRLRVTPMHDEEGKLLGAVAVLEDVTHLRELDRLKTEFIGVASHELRTPVASLQLAVDLLEEGAVGELTAQQREVVAAQREDLIRLERLTADLLDLTRLEQGAMPPRFELVAAAALLESAARAVEAQAAAKQIDLKVSTGRKPVYVRADPAQIGRVLVNLLGNAIRHSPNGREVQLSAEGHGGCVEFRVKDSGTGIPPEYLDRVFDRFFQVPGATRGGAGLGLSIAQSIARAHGSEIRVESAPSQGSVFHFTLPSARMSRTGRKPAPGGEHAVEAAQDQK